MTDLRTWLLAYAPRVHDRDFPDLHIDRVIRRYDPHRRIAQALDVFARARALIHAQGFDVVPTMVQSMYGRASPRVRLPASFAELDPAFDWSPPSLVLLPPGAERWLKRARLTELPSPFQPGVRVVLMEWFRNHERVIGESLWIFDGDSPSPLGWGGRSPCRCCRWLAQPDTPAGTYDVCPDCGWEDDPLQAVDPTAEGGANRVSLLQARENYLRFGTVDPPRGGWEGG